MLYALDEKIIIEVAKAKRDLRRAGGSGPENEGAKPEQNSG